MRTTIASATFLLLGAGVASVGARSGIHPLGSDTLRDLTKGVLAGVGTTAACPGTAGLVYEGTGSSNGANEMRKGAQAAAPMSSSLSAANVCSPSAGLPQVGQEAEGLVFAVDGLSIAVKPGNATDANCGGVAFNTTGGAKLVVNTDCTSLGCVAGTTPGTFEYRPSDEKDYLRVLFFGMHNHTNAASTVRDCNSSVRKALVANYKNLFQTPATCTGGTCAGKPLRHAFRRDDGSGTTDVFVASIGVPSVYSPNKPTYSATAAQQSNPFCNAGPVSPSNHNVPGIHLGFDGSETPATGPNWNTKVGDSDFADLDPIRVDCDDGDEVCGGDGSGRMGLVQVVFPLEVPTAQNYPVDECDGGAFDLKDAPSDIGYFGTCGDGSPAIVGGCVIGYKTCTAGSPCTSDTGTPITTGRNFNCRQPTGLGNCYLLAPGGLSGSECRGANNWMRKTSGAIVTDTSLGAINARPYLGGFFRMHTTTAVGGAGFPGCKSSSATFQIGCLVGSADPCSIGYAGREATDGAGAPADGVSIKAIPPTKANIQKLVSPDPAIFATRYPLSRKLYYNSIIGFGTTAFTAPAATPAVGPNVPVDPLGPGVTGEELNLGKCLAMASYRPIWEANYGFIELPAATNGTFAFCEDFNAMRRCAGGASSGAACTIDADCPGSTCTLGCAGVAANIDACANNPAGIPKADGT